MSEMSFFANSIMDQKYAHDLGDGTKETWSQIADRVSHNVMKALNIRKNYIDDVKELIEQRKFMPGGRYLYASGRPFHQVQNCLLLRAEDSREGWADLMHKASMALMTGAGIGIDYSTIRPEGKPVRKTGGTATGPLALMQMVNEAGRGIMQGGSRRCLPDSSKITMGDGSLKCIADIKVGDQVLTRFGVYPVTNVFDQGIQELIRITTQNGVITTSRKHKLLSSGRSRTKTFYTPTEALNIDSKLYRYYNPVVTGGYDFNIDLAYVIGYFLGDGCAYTWNDRVHEATFQLAGRKYNQKQLKKIIGVLDELGFKTAVRNGHGDCTEIRCQSINAYNYFAEYKQPNMSFSIPEIIKGAHLEARYAFLAGWWDADGYLGKDSWKLANTHEGTRKELRSFMEDLGFVTSEQGIEVRLSSYQRQSFSETVLKHGFKRSKFKTRKSTSEVPTDIISIEQVGASHTFDIEVAVVHEFIADGFVSHNSAIWAGLNWKHADAHKFVMMKNWIPEVRHLKEKDFNFPATMDGTNISIQLDDEFFKAYGNEKHVLHSQAQSIYWAVVKSMLKTAEPGFSIDLGENSGETLRNAPVSANTYIMTDEGYVRVGDIVDEEITVWTGKQYARTIFKKTKEYAAVVKVKMTGGREIVCDPTHEFFLEDKTKRAASDLLPGDSLHISMPNFGRSRGVKGDISDFKSYTLGYVYGDGTFHKKYPRAEVTLCTEESKACSSYLSVISSSMTSPDSRGFTRIYYRNNPIFDKRSKNTFPEDVYTWGPGKIADFIAGLFDADGNYHALQNRVRLASKHKDFLVGVRRCLESLGILSGISTAGISTYGQSQGYMLTINTEYVDDFADKIPTKRLKIQPYEAYRLTKIKVVSVEESGFEDVFCCDVGVEEHSFMAEGVIISNCTEVSSRDDSDICNLGSINMARIESLEEMKKVVELGTLFLLAGTAYSDVPYSKVDQIRTKNRRLGLGLMGLHEWLLLRGKKYEKDDELQKYLEVYATSTEVAKKYADKYDISAPLKTRAIAPTGTIGIVAETTTGIEPIFCVAYKRRYKKGADMNAFQYVIDPTAKRLIDKGVNHELIEDAYVLADDVERRVAFQSWVQGYVDHSISSTINLPSWGSEQNNEGTVTDFGRMLYKYLPSLRGITCYPDGARGGQPLSPVRYLTAAKHTGEVFYENVDVCELKGGGSCGS